MDPVTQYATDVCAGRVVAARLVRLACERHLKDLREAQGRGLVWRPDAAQNVIDFFAEVLCLPDENATSGAGKPFILSPFQQFIAGSLFGWYTVHGWRRFHHAYVETAKGSGKTPFGAGLLIYMALADGERGAQCYCAAVTKDQAKLAFTDCENMVKASPHLADAFDQKVNNLAILETGCFIRPISAEKRGLDGKRVHGALIDELHEHPSNVVTTKISAGIKNRQNALVLEITNSGFDRETVCWQHHDYSRQVLEGTVENDAWFAFVCHLDACEKCHGAGAYQPPDECPDCDDWKVEGPHWLKANPNLGVSLSWQYLREQVRKGIDMPSERNMVRRLNFCQWTQQATVWIPLEKWTACRTTLLPAAFVGRPCFVGLDLSAKIDLSAAVLIFPRELGDGINTAIDVLPFFWMPEASIYRRAEEDGVEYPRWQKEGHVFATTGSMVDHDAISDFILDNLAKKYRIQGVGVDMAGAAAVVARLQRVLGDKAVIEIPQGFRGMSEPCKTVEAMIVSGKLAHPGNPCLDWNVSNAAVEENNWREIRPVKIDQRKRIDGLVALVDAVAVMLDLRQPGSIYMTHRVRTLGETLADARA